MGENVFRRLEENFARLNILVSEIHQTFGLDQTPIVLPTRVSTSINKTISTKPPIHDNASQPTRNREFTNDAINIPTDQTESMSSEGSEHILAASALCQLATPDENLDQNSGKRGWRK
jgi:hypothetical protein